MTDSTETLCMRCWEVEGADLYDVEGEAFPVLLCAMCAAEYEVCPVCHETLAAELADLERVELFHGTRETPPEYGYRCERCAAKGKRAVSL